MRKAFRHTGVLMMVAVVALGLLGAAYTLWYENLSLTVQANTGSFNADMSFANWNGTGYDADVTSGSGSGQPVVGVFGPTQNMSCSRSAWGAMTKPANCNYIGYNNFNNANWIFNNVNKLTDDFKCDVSITTAGTNGTGWTGWPALPDSNDTVSNNSLLLTMSGLFPYAGCEYKFDIHNSGSVPMHLTKGPLGIYKKCNLNAGPNDTSCVNLSSDAPALSFATAGQDPHSNPNPTANDLMCAALLSTAPGQLVVDANNKPIQIHPGQNVDCTFKAIFDEAAGGENHTFYVSWSWTAHQWNEPASAPVFGDKP